MRSSEEATGEAPRRVMGESWPAQAIVTGQGHGLPLLLSEPLSFWGGYDAARGCIIEAGHPQRGAELGGRVLLMASAKGSSSSSSVLAEAIRHGTGPVAIVMRERDLIVGLGCIVASELYGLHVPVVVVDAPAWQALVGLGSAELQAMHSPHAPYAPHAPQAPQALHELHIEAAAPGDCLIRTLPVGAHNAPHTTGDTP